MLRQPVRRLALTALCLSFAGCATVYSFPKPMGGVRTHVEMVGITSNPGNYLRGLGTVVWLVAFPVSVTDLALSLGADLALLPILGPPVLVGAIRESRREALREHLAEERAEAEVARRPPPPTPEQVAMTERRRAVERAQAARAAQERATLERVTTDAWRAAESDPDEQHRVSGVLDRLFGSPQVISRSEDTFIWLRASNPVDGPADARQLGALMDGAEAHGERPTGRIMAAHLAERRGDAARALELCDAALDGDPLQAPAWIVRGWARIQLGDLDRAETDLGLGEVLCLCELNRAWATIGLGRVAEARGRWVEARLRYEQVLGEPTQVAQLQLGGVDHVSDLRRRVGALSLRRAGE